MVSALLFVENQGLLNPEYPSMNPALDWKRLSRAVIDRAIRFADSSHESPGGSTLATQIEKYRHSPEGRTQSVPEKFRQMASASLRAYMDGPDTQRARDAVGGLPQYRAAVRAGGLWRSQWHRRRAVGSGTARTSARSIS
ncbi:transglycosylase domain-containing protein [Cupriavidus basilensis]